MVDSTETPTASAETRAGARRSKALLAITSLVLVILAIAVVVSSFGLGYWTSLGPGPGFFPFWIGALLGAAALVWMIQALTGHPSAARPDEDGDSAAGEGDLERAKPPTARNLPLWTILLSLVVCAVLLEIVGFQLAMFAFLLFMLKVQGGRRWLVSLILSAVGSFGVFGLFTLVLQVSLPTAAIPLLADLGL